MIESKTALFLSFVRKKAEQNPKFPCSTTGRSNNSVSFQRCQVDHTWPFSHFSSKPFLSLTVTREHKYSEYCCCLYVKSNQPQRERESSQFKILVSLAHYYKHLRCKLALVWVRQLCPNLLSANIFRQPMRNVFTIASLNRHRNVAVLSRSTNPLLFTLHCIYYSFCFILEKMQEQK